MSIIYNSMRIFSKKYLIILNRLPLNQKIKKNQGKLIDKYLPNTFTNKSFLTYVYKKTKGYNLLCNKIETIALRGSTADYGFQPNIIDNSYNFGLTSSDLYTTFEQYKQIRKDCSNLKNVILFWNVAISGYSLINTSERYRAVIYNYFLGIPLQTRDYILPCIEKQILRKCKKINSQDIVIDNQYKGFIKNKSYSTIKADKRVCTHIRENQREPDQMIWFQKLQDFVKHDNKNLIVVIAPCREDYKNLLPDKKELFKKLYKDIGDISLLIDCYDCKDFTEKDFGDTDHLSDQGAAKLTQIIKKAMLRHDLINE